jgi:hypothetical protein
MISNYFRESAVGIIILNKDACPGTLASRVKDIRLLLVTQGLDTLLCPLVSLSKLYLKLEHHRMFVAFCHDKPCVDQMVVDGGSALQRKNIKRNNCLSKKLVGSIE